jgi:hypothetical protein
MKAAIVEKPGELVVREIEAPVVREYDALCRMLFGATCTGTDTHLIDGCFPWPVNSPRFSATTASGGLSRWGRKFGTRSAPAWHGFDYFKFSY